MSMDMDISMEEGFLRADVGGVFVLHKANDCFARLIQTIAEHKTNRVLVDIRELTGTLTTMDRYEHSVFAANALSRAYSSGVSPATRFAYVAKPPVLDNERFGETVAKNRGVNVHSTDNMEEAIEWLERS